ncbi:hypothetical protein AB0A05_27370 [Streptomyces sp. NPDC046374]|uniref:hypothetical protein n=1 Tax=Streptomyces sp. NPDC046374 TaxID=3154917 RepID=UPI0033F3E7EC
MSGCGCNGGGGRGRQVTVTAGGTAYSTGENDVRWVHTSPGGSTTPYNSPEEAQVAVNIDGGRMVKMDTRTGRAID